MATPNNAGSLLGAFVRSGPVGAGLELAKQKVLNTDLGKKTTAAVSNFAKEAFLRTPVRLGVTGAAVAEDTARLLTGKYDATTPERVTTGYNVPGFGQVKPFGAAVGTTKENLKLPSMKSQALEGGAAAFDIASTLTMFQPAKAVQAGIGAASKLVKPAGMVERAISKLPTAAQRVLPKSSTVTGALGRLGVQGASDFTVGALSSAAADVARGDVSSEDIKKNALISGGISALLPLSVATISGTAKGVARQVGQSESLAIGARNTLRTIAEEAGILDKSAQSLERKGNLGRVLKTKLFEREQSLADDLARLKKEAAAGTTEVVAGVSGKVGASPDVLKKIESTETALKRTQRMRDLSTKWLDDRAPVMNNIAVLRSKGMDEADERDLMNLTDRSRVTDTTVTGDMLARAERLEELRPKDIPQDWWRKRVDEYADLKTKLETTRDDLAGQAKNQARLAQIEAEFKARGDDSWEKLQQAHNDVVLTKNMEQLDKNVEAGLISAEEAARLKTENPNYSRLVALDYLDEADRKNVFTRGQSSGIKGDEWKARSAQARADFETLGATEANALSAYAAEARRAKNVQLRNLVDKNLEFNTGVFEKVPEMADGVIAFKRNGVEEFYKVKDRQMLEYIRGQEKQAAEGVLKVIQGGANWVRKFATGVNPVFGLSNMIRDYNSAVMNVGSKIPMGVDDVVGNLERAYSYTGKRSAKVDPKIKEVLDIGGPLTFISREVRGGEAEDIISLFSDKQPAKSAFDGLSRLNEASELATRLGVYDAAKRAGITDKDTLRNLMRDATVDFTKAGTAMRDLNKAIPFMNARLQGLRNTVRAFANDPAGFTRKAQIYAVFPQMMVNQWNERYGSLKDRISTSDQDNFYPFIFGKYKDQEGNEQPLYVRIPKGQTQQISGVIQSLVENDNKLTPKEQSHRLLGALFEQSPINQVPEFGGPLLGVLKGLATNKDSRGYSIVPDYLNTPETPARFKKRASTSKSIEGITDALSRLTGGTESKEGLIEVSPAQLEFAIQQGIPGLGGQGIDLLDTFRNIARTGSIRPENRVTDSVGADLAQLPFTSFFVRDKALAAPQYVTERNISTQKQLNIDKGAVKEAAQSKIQEIRNAPDEATQRDIISRLSQEEQVAIKKELENKGGYVYGVKPGDPPKQRAVQVYNALQSVTPEEAPQILQRMKEERLITDDTGSYLKAYAIHQKLQELNTPDEKEALLRPLLESGSITYDDLVKLAEYKKELE